MRINTYQTSASVFALLISAEVSAPAMAQGVDYKDTIIVSATKRDESIIDVPMSVGVVTGLELERANITNIQDLGFRVPGLSIQQFGSRSEVGYMFIRGLGNNVANRTLRAAALIDDVPITDFFSLNSNLIELEQIEILRGPQSTLYGLTAEAGLVVAKSRKPGNEFGGRLATQYTTFGDVSVTASVDLPIFEDVLTIGGAFFYEDVDGFIDNQLTGNDYDSGASTNARIRAIFTPTENLEFDFVYTSDDIDDNFGQAFIPLDREAYVATFSQPPFQATASIPFTSLDPIGKYETASDWAGASDLYSDNLSLRTGLNVGGYEFVSVTSYRDFELFKSFDIGNIPGSFPFGPPPGLQAGESSETVESFYQEIRAASPSENAFRWIAGAVYYHSEATSSARSARFFEPQEVAPGVFLDGIELDPFPGSATFESLGFFGQAEYNLTDNIEILAGLRYEEVDSVSQSFVDGVPDAEFSDHVWLPKGTISFTPDNATRIYATVARGWLPGFAAVLPAAGDPDGIMDSETSLTYELGVKREILNGRGRISAAIYQNNIDDYQEAIEVGLLGDILENVPGVRIRGFEVEAGAALTDRLTLSGGFGYNDAVYQDFVETIAVSPTQEVEFDFDGNRIANVPEYNFNVVLNMAWTNSFFTEIEFVGQGEFLEREDRTGGNGAFFDPGTPSDPTDDIALRPAFGTFDGFGIINLRAGYDGERWSVLAFANNLENERYFALVSNQFGTATNPYLQGTGGRPFEAGVRFTVRY